MTATGGEALFFNYRLNLAGGVRKDFLIRLDPKTCQLIQTPPDPLPDWTRLECQQCPNCPLSTKTSPHCPVAVGLTGVIDAMKDILSYTQCDVTVETNERTYSASMPVANAASSIIGIHMATSGCPILDKLRPMARFHLPFSSLEETLFRALSTYLLAQYFLQKQQRQPDWELKGLARIYEEIGKVNSAFSRRLREIRLEDAALNAITRLDCFGLSVNFIINDQRIADIESPFQVYFT